MSSVLETFFILFETDAKEVKQGVTAAKESTKDLEKELSNTDKAATAVGGRFLELSKSAVGALAAITAGFVAGSAFFAAVDYADKLDETSGALDIQVETLDAWGQAVHMAGGDASGFFGTLKNLSAAMAATDVMGKSRLLPFFKELGVNMLDAAGNARPVMDLLPELADSFEKMSKQDALGMGQKLGLDQGTIMLLQQGRRAVDDMLARQKELGLVSTDNAAQAAKFNDQIDYTARSFRSLYVSIGSAILPGLTAVLQGLESGVTWVRNNQELVTGFFIAVGAVVAYAYVPAMLEAAVATLLATWPIIAIVAAIAALAAVFAVVYDDIMAFIDGQDSLIGTVVEAVSQIKILRAIVDLVGAAFGYVSGKLTEFIENSTVIQRVVLGMKAAFWVLQQVIEAVGNAFAWVGQQYDKVKGFIGGKISAAYDATVGTIEQGAASLNAASSMPANAMTSTAITSASSRSANNSVQIGEVHVNTQATDAEGISKSIGASMGSQMRQAVTTFDDGVKG